jgi:electron transport complex protein RnfG
VPLNTKAVKTVLRAGTTLGIIASTVGLAASTNAPGPEAVADVARNAVVLMLAQVLPVFDNRPEVNTCILNENGTNWTFYVARKEGKFVGAAFLSSSTRGYGGLIQVMVGVQAGDTVRKIEILSHRETADIGSRIADPDFRNGFTNRSIARTVWKLKDDGGDLDAISGATISSRAVVEAVRNGLDVYRKHAEEIARTGK